MAYGTCRFYWNIIQDIQGALESCSPEGWSVEVETFKVDVKNVFDCVPVAWKELVGGS